MELKLLKEVRSCQLCKSDLPMGARPVLQMSSQARILIAGQAPGVRVHESGVPFDDASGDRLREWMGVERETFYNARKVAILPMGFCYPGTGKSGDLPPRKECAAEWRERLMREMKDLKLTLVIGQYAQAWHLKEQRRKSLTETVRAWKVFYPAIIPLPHPSPRNNIWMKRNPWFAEEVLPSLRKRVKRVLRN